MRVTVIGGADLDTGLLDRWRFLQHSNEHLASPFFSPEYFVAAAKVRQDARVAVIEADGEISGFFPFQRGPFGFGLPVGGPLSDYHGLIAAPGAKWSATHLLSGCGLCSWHFNHLPATQDTFQPFARRRAISPIIDVSKGYDVYATAQRLRGSEQIEQCSRKLRKLEREVGRTRFEPHVSDPALLEELMRWKGRQYIRTGGVDLFARGWVRRLIGELHANRTDSFGGMLSVLYVKEKPAAIHFGMRSSAVLHYWFPAYVPELGKYSVGMILLLKIAEAAAFAGVRNIDLGKGEQRYKTQLMNQCVPLAEGWVTLQTPIARSYGLVREVEHFIRSHPSIRNPLRRWIRRWRSAMKDMKGT